MAYAPALGTAFWYDLDKSTLYDSTFMGTVLRDANAARVQDLYHHARTTGTYPGELARLATDHRAAWDAIATLQRTIINRHFPNDPDGLRQAFEDFGQGVLLDDHPERVMNQDRVHMMDTGGDQPPVGYHRWHASIRTIQTFDADPWWETLARLVGLAWAIQSTARPVQSPDTNGPNPNQPLSTTTINKLRQTWSGLGLDRLDRQYDLGGGTYGYHPKPEEPVA